MAERFASEKIVVSAPFSFNGSALRIWKITDTENYALKWFLLIPAALILVCCAWMLVAVWYVIMYVCLGILFIPYRLIRRSGRKQKRDKLRHREIIDAIEKQKQ